MKVLVIGGGGREHALVWQLGRHGHEVYCLPGNAGIAEQARCVSIDQNDVGAIARVARENKIDLTIAGPEAPLVAGIADEFRRRGMLLFGPDSRGARLEGDKSFAKRLMRDSGIATAQFEVFEHPDRALAYLKSQRLPVVVKASGLAAGKGVVICQTSDEAAATVTEMMSGRRFGQAGTKVVIEEFLEGEEASIIGLCDGRTFKYLLPSQDHKRLLDGDQGPNTGGMGAYAPAPVVTREVQSTVERRVFEPLLAGLGREGVDYRGVVYAGMMMTQRGPLVLEFNCRFGDPETQAMMPLLETDIAELALACIEGQLDKTDVRWSSRHAMCVVAAARGYPESYRKGEPITFEEPGSPDIAVFHAGTKRVGEHVVTNGGRVLGVTGLGDSLATARNRAYSALSRIRFQGMVFRQDIGARALRSTVPD